MGSASRVRVNEAQSGINLCVVKVFAGEQKGFSELKQFGRGFRRREIEVFVGAARGDTAR